jgi:tetratricopeptide (TPR) repeat protein
MQTKQKNNKAYPFSNYQLARIYFIKGNLNASLYYANKELELYPDHCRTYYIRGLTYGYMNDLDRAIDDFKIFNTSCVTNSWAGHNDLAWFYFRKGDIQNMSNIIEPMVTRYPTNPWVQNTYGIALLNLKKYKEAENAFVQALTYADLMTERSWGTAYPGNNPDIYNQGLEAMRKTIQQNLTLTEKELQGKAMSTPSTE